MIGISNSFCVFIMVRIVHRQERDRLSERALLDIGSVTRVVGAFTNNFIDRNIFRKQRTMSDPTSVVPLTSSIPF